MVFVNDNETKLDLTLIFMAFLVCISYKWPSYGGHAIFCLLYKMYSKTWCERQTIDDNLKILSKKLLKKITNLSTIDSYNIMKKLPFG